jgi:hypothetical protein
MGEGSRIMRKRGRGERERERQAGIITVHLQGNWFLNISIPHWFLVN